MTLKHDLELQIAVDKVRNRGAALLGRDNHSECAEPLRLCPRTLRRSPATCHLKSLQLNRCGVCKRTAQRFLSLNLQY
ncbi:hypothetical protein Y032_0054g2501 [Ancylostoma ceylanicum]|uniref:Uncharacterized protein n=1 Tax=Ancylostoma ceylanicum TaxID=53326 RepID=A0A016U7X5_9BILA|nr:hypothetical protein Y032_0054g2501 [Ancylostoma ceylanicum]